MFAFPILKTLFYTMLHCSKTYVPSGTMHWHYIIKYSYIFSLKRKGEDDSVDQTVGPSTKKKKKSKHHSKNTEKTPNISENSNRHTETGADSLENDSHRKTSKSEIGNGNDEVTLRREKTPGGSSKKKKRRHSESISE